MNNQELIHIFLKTQREIIDHLLANIDSNEINIDNLLADNIRELWDHNHPYFLSRLLDEKFERFQRQLANSNFKCQFTEKSQADMKYMLAASTESRLEVRKTGLKEIRDFTAGAEELIVVDPYMFGGDTVRADTYIAEFEKSARIGSPTLKRLHIVFDSSMGRTTAIKTKLKKLAIEKGIRLTACDTDKIHDRIWIKDRKYAIIVGTSFGGIGSRLCFILDLPSYDLEALLEYMGNEKMFTEKF